jgi:type III pantothenate kinase
MNLAIDCGNTYSKVAVFDKENLITFQERLDFQAISNLTHAYPIDKILICDVANRSHELLTHLNTSIPTHQLTYQTPLPIKNLYETPQTLGMDRLAAVIGAYFLFPQTACIVIDAGSCITYDYLSSKGEYLGGSISLGLQMRFRALHEFTAKLPLLKPSEALQVNQIGKTTAQAIESGVVNGFLHEIEAIIEEYIFKNKPVKILLCGGDANFIGERIKHRNTVMPTLLLQGLNYVFSRVN